MISHKWSIKGQSRFVLSDATHASAYLHTTLLVLTKKCKRLKTQSPNEMRCADWAYMEKVVCLLMKTRNNHNPSGRFWGETIQRWWVYQLWRHLIETTRWGTLWTRQLSSFINFSRHLSPKFLWLKPTLSHRCFTNMIENCILKLLSGLDPNEACEPNQILPAFLIG